jgi:phosphonate transport system ATP-binding protein
MLLLADESVASLDPELSRQILALLRGLAATRKMALPCPRHQPDLAHEYFDRVIDLRRAEVTPSRDLAAAS